MSQAAREMELLKEIQYFYAMFDYSGHEDWLREAQASEHELSMIEFAIH